MVEARVCELDRGACERGGRQLRMLAEASGRAGRGGQAGACLAMARRVARRGRAVGGGGEAGVYGAVLGGEGLLGMFLEDEREEVTYGLALLLRDCLEAGGEAWGCQAYLAKLQAMSLAHLGSISAKGKGGGGGVALSVVWMLRTVLPCRYASGVVARLLSLGPAGELEPETMASGTLHENPKTIGTKP